MKTLINFREMVDKYIREDRSTAQEELSYYRRQPSLEAAVREAGLAHNAEGKKDFHQWRFRQITLDDSVEHLVSDIRKIERAATFDELHSLIVRTLEPVPGAGELFCYDTALRIGAKKLMSPEKVYLHRGTREGAKALNLDVKAVALEISVFPPEFRVLQPHEIEDLLCRFRDELRGNCSRSRCLKPHCRRKISRRRVCGTQVH